MSDEKIQKKKDQNKARQAKHYALNKDEINAKRREKYRNCIAEYMQDAGVDVDKSKLPYKPTFLVNGKKMIDLSKFKKLSTDEVLNYLDLLEMNENTLKKYKDDLKRFVSITDCKDNILFCLKRHAKIISDIKNGTKHNGQRYSNNTLKSVYQIILLMIDRFNLKINKKPYLREYEIALLQSEEDNKEKAEREPVIKFSAYLNRVKDYFGENSKMYVLARLYDELTLRDDYQLIMIDNIKEATDDTKNYIVMYPTRPLKLIINSYKTQELYKTINENLSSDLSKLIRKYVKQNKLEKGDYLFGNQKLYGFINTNNKLIGLSGGASEFRHMKVSEELAKVPSLEERKQLSERMRHSVITQLKYVRKILKE